MDQRVRVLLALKATRRDAVLARGGYRVLRLDAAVFAQDIETAVCLVKAELKP